jgi:hypothetical protein
MLDDRRLHEPLQPPATPTETEDLERLTIIAPYAGAGSVSLEFHRQRLRELGFVLAGRIERHQFQQVDGPDYPVEMFDGRPYYAATFIRPIPSSSDQG